MNLPTTPTKRTMPRQPNHTPPSSTSKSTPRATPSTTIFTSPRTPQSSYLSSPRTTQKRRTPNLPLPTELRDQILTYLLTMETTPVEYLPAKVRAQKLAYALAHSRPAPTVCTHQLTLRKIYFSLCLVSKGMKEDATRVLFYVNEWFLRLSLVRDLMPDGLGERTGRVKGKGMGLFRGRNGVSEIRGVFGANALLWVRELRVKIISEDPRAEERMKGFIRDLVAVLKESRVLKTLLIQWINYYSVDGRMGVLGRKFEIRKIRLMRRRTEARDPRRIVYVPDKQCVERWEKEEKILSPLLRLRGVPEVHIVGCVTDEWAEYLESVMMSKEGFVNDFVRLKQLVHF